VKLGDFTALRPFRRRGAYSTGRYSKGAGFVARPPERAVGGGDYAGDTLHLSIMIRKIGS
jgi:hypothetical protein